MTDITQSDIGTALGVSGATVSRWESDESMPPPPTVARLAAYFGVTAGWLQFGEGTKGAESTTERRLVPDPRQTLEKPAAKAAGARKRGR